MFKDVNLKSLVYNLILFENDSLKYYFLFENLFLQTRPDKIFFFQRSPHKKNPQKGIPVKKRRPSKKTNPFQKDFTF